MDEQKISSFFDTLSFFYYILKHHSINKTEFRFFPLPRFIESFRLGRTDKIIQSKVNPALPNAKSITELCPQMPQIF